MRLLQYDRFDNVSFTADLPEDEAFALKYAILSHTWGKDGDEVVYEDILADKGTDKPGYKKVRFCVQQARQDGLQYFWIDTCCIDKKNLVELSKSLISMYRWYANARKCYAFLSDVPQKEHGNDNSSHHEGEGGQGVGSEFRFSRWFKRGWTLQELLAPTTVEFFSKTWSLLGTKISLEKQINQITKIPIPALRGKAMTDFTIHERRQWQEGRETKEPEDLVYSLLGLLDISMPVIYGEGRAKALQRLQNEIDIAMKGVRHNDFSLNFSLAEAVETQNFVAREKELQEMRSALSGDGSRKAVVLYGLGGIGKTQLAIAYAKRHRDDYSAVFWLNVKDTESARASCTAMAKFILREHPSALQLSGLNVVHNMDEVVEAVKAWYSMPMNCRWLMICDNYDNPKVPGNTDPAAVDLRRYLPEALQGHVIVTTRYSEFKLGKCISIRKLDQLQDSIKILEDMSGRENLAQDEDAVRLTTKLDGLPLALATAGAYLSQSTVTFKKYFDFYEQSWAKLQKLSPALDTYEYKTLFSTWQISYELIERRNRAAAQLLRFWAYFDNQDLWFELLSYRLSSDPSWLRELTEDQMAFEAGIRVLISHGLVEVNSMNEFNIDSRGYSVHACVHSWMTSVLNTQHNNDLAGTALLHVAARLDYDPDQSSILMQRRLLNHAHRCCSYFQSDNESRPNMVLAYNSLGDLFGALGEYLEAEKMLKRGLRGYQETLGYDSPFTVDPAFYLAIIYLQQGKHLKAATLASRARDISEASYGRFSSKTIDLVHLITEICLRDGRFLDLKTLSTSVLDDFEKSKGRNRPVSLDAVNSIGLVYFQHGKLDEAEIMFRRVLNGCEKARERGKTVEIEDHPILSFLFSNIEERTGTEKSYAQALGEVYSHGIRNYLSMSGATKERIRVLEDQGYLSPFNEESKRQQADAGDTLGPNERDYSYRLTRIYDRALNNLAIVNSKQGKHKEVEVLYLRALKRQEKIFGPDSPRTLFTVVNLSCHYFNEQKYTDATEFYRRAMKNYHRIAPHRRIELDSLGRLLYVLDTNKEDP